MALAVEVTRDLLGCELAPTGTTTDLPVHLAEDALSAHCRDQIELASNRLNEVILRQSAIFVNFG